MEAGNWDQAVKAFGQALDNARGTACTKEAQYLAAVRLLKASPLLQAICQVHVAVSRLSLVSMQLVVSGGQLVEHSVVRVVGRDLRPVRVFSEACP